LWQRFFIVVLAAINLFLIYQLLWSNQGVFDYVELKKHHDRLEQRIQEMEDRCRRLSEEIRWLSSDKEYLEKIIRTEMHYLKDGEILYLFPDAPSENQENPGQSNASQD